MRKFLYKVVLFSIPVLLFLIPPMVALKVSGENYTSIDNLIERKESYLIGYAYNEDNYKYLKWKEVNTRQKQDVLALGSSRILQFREGMFDSSFYNAGYTIVSVSDFVPFLNSIPKSKYPEVLLISLDQWMFNENWDALDGPGANESKWRRSFNENAHMSTQLSVWSDLLDAKYSYIDLLTKAENSSIEKVGLNAVVNGKGFRNDGSMNYGDQIHKLINKDPSANDHNFQGTFSRIDQGNNRFEYGEQVNSRALKELDEFLSFCSANDVYVVAVLPPFADKVNERLKSSGKHAYVNKVYPASKVIFDRYGFELWDMTHLAKFNSGDEEVVDGFHGGEVAYLKMLTYMVEKDSKLKEYTSLVGLKEDLAKRSNDYLVYDHYMEDTYVRNENLDEHRGGVRKVVDVMRDQQ